MARLGILVKVKTLLWLLNIVAVTTTAENECLCQFDDVHCKRIVEDDVVFYSTATFYYIYHHDFSIYYSGPKNVISSGIVKCWKPNFKPKIIEIGMCNYRENFPGFSRFGSNIINTSDAVDCITKISVCSLGNGTSILVRGLDNQNPNDLFGAVVSALSFPEEVQMISISDVRVNIDDDAMRNLTALKYLSLNKIQLEEISTQFLNNAGELIAVSFSYNTIKEVRSESFMNQRKLRILNLNYNAIESLGICTTNETNNFLTYLKSLQQLFVNHNRLTKICPNLFQCGSNLMKLRLSNNEITSLRDVFLSEEIKIMDLDLSHNMLEYISDKDLLFLTKLFVLDLSYNHIKFIDKFAFEFTSFLIRKLSIDDNFLNSSDFLLPMKIYSSSYVSLRNNNLQNLPKFAEIELQFSGLDLTGNHISYLEFSNLLAGKFGDGRTLNLQNNNIKTIGFQMSDAKKLLNFEVKLDNNPLTCDCSVKLFQAFITSIFSVDSLYCYKPESLRGSLFKDVDNRFLHCAERNRCPRNCTCQFQQTETKVNCNDKEFTTIPEDVPRNATYLSMKFNPLVSLKNLKKWNFLQSLTLEYCPKLDNITESDAMELKQLENLSMLSLENNNLTSLPLSMLDGLTNLSSLKLGRNMLTSLPKNIISSLTHLSHFSVHNNRLGTLDDAIFETNEELRVINLCCNKLSTVTMNISHLQQLIYVDFSDNDIIIINIQWPRNVKEILLKGNRIGSFNLINIPENLHRLDLSENNFQHLDMAIFEQFVHANAVFDFSNNLITTISEMNLPVETSRNEKFVIILNYNPLRCDCRIKSFLHYTRIESYMTKIFFKMENLTCNSPESMKNKLVEDLDISKLPCEQDQCAINCQCYKQLESDYRIMECDKLPGNNFVDVVNELHIQDAGESNLLELVSSEWKSLNAITIHKFSGNSLTSAIFSSMENLTAIAIIDNKNLQLYSNVFSNLSALVNLDLHSSGISSIPANSFQRDFRMQNLNLSYNFLRELPKNIFVDLISLQTLDLSGNSLNQLQSNLFEKLRYLKSLILKQNHLEKLQSDVFLNCTSLEVLDLSKNLLTSYGLQFLFVPPLISQFILSTNFATNIERRWSNLRHLKYFDLSFNSIAVVNVSQLSVFPNNINFNLQSNNISQVIWFDDKYEEKISFFNMNLENNPFVCDCNLKQFVHYVSQLNKSKIGVGDVKNLHCDQPLELTGVPLFNIVNENLYCNLENCSSGCSCKRSSKGEINVVDCNVTRETDLRICPDIVNELYLCGNLSVTFLRNSCWKLLKKLYASQNVFLTNVSNDLLQNIELLVELGLVANQMCQVPSKLFQFTSNIEVVDFSNNLLQKLSFQMFKNLFKLRKVDLSGNRLKLIDWEIPLSLESLNLAENIIVNVAIPKLNDHYRLTNFNLSSNRLKMVPNKPEFLFHLKNLQTLDLSHNDIAIDCNVQFHLFPKSLQSLNLSHNLLNCTKFWSDHNEPLPKLSHYDLSHNPIVSLYIEDFIFSNNSELVLVMRNCNIKNYSLNITHAKNESWNIVSSIDISNNKLIECDCNIRQLSDFKKIQNGGLTLDLQLVTNSPCNLNSFDINFNLISKFDSIPNSTFCSLIENCSTRCSCMKSDVAVQMFCVKIGLTSLPSICPLNVQYLNLDYNNLTVVKDLNHSNWYRLITISLRHNNIRFISNENITSLKFLQFLFLDGNELYSPSGWLEYFVSENLLPFNITLSDNPWSCNCDNELFKKWVINFSSKQLILDVGNMFCSDGNLFVNVDMCPVDILIILLPVLAVTLVIISVLILTVFYYRKKMLVHAWCYSKNVCGWCVNEAEIDKNKVYDAFLSYCEEDELYATRELLPGLEEEKPFYKVCVHQRDWIAGVPIAEQIENSVKNSRRTIIVLSRNFANSTWANIEFRVANLQSLEDKINRVIAITLDDDFLTDDLDPEFRAYLSMTTYLKADDPQFWNKLRFAMPCKAPPSKRVRHQTVSNLNLTEVEDTV